MSNSEEYFQKKLFELQDIKYRDFNSKLLPTVDPKTIIGVRIPEMRKLTKAFAGTLEGTEFLRTLPHKYYDENCLHGFFIEEIKDYDQTIKSINTFLPYVDNWATCDSMSPKIFKKHLPELLNEIKKWLQSSHAYTIRFGIKILMSFYLGDAFKPEYLELVADIKSEEYYVNMMIAWFFATALAKQYEYTLPCIEKKRLEKWSHNKSIQKAIESYRITDEQKTYLRTLKLK